MGSSPFFKKKNYFEYQYIKIKKKFNKKIFKKIKEYNLQPNRLPEKEE
jgi:hypothetical protein